MRHGWLVALRVTRGWCSGRERSTESWKFLVARSEAPPSVLPDISPLEGEMSGRTEGGRPSI
ncbi:hypothetical protein DXT90_07275 [Agrobacterium tumefaciens]|nr:hypothetical protein [Agrobacterium tumefaciens]